MTTTKITKKGISDQIHLQIRIAGEKLEILRKMKKWINNNALEQTSCGNLSWNDSDIMFKKTDTKTQGDWTQKTWDEKIKNFTPQYIKHHELTQYLKQLEENI